MAIVTTIHGEMDDSQLEHRSGIDNVPEGEAHWTEYWLNGELVHRSVHLFIKEGVNLFGQSAALA